MEFSRGDYKVSKIIRMMGEVRLGIDIEDFKQYKWK